MPPQAMVDRIVRVLRRAPLIDGHNDLLWELQTLREKGADEPDIGSSCPQLQTDLARMWSGGVGGQFWSVYVPSDLPEERAVVAALEKIDELKRIVRTHHARLELARTADDVERIAAAGKVASLIGIEGGHMIASSLGVLRMLAELGASYLTLTHDGDTSWADASAGRHGHHGLTGSGEEIVHELNRLGVLVDLSHTSEETMRRAIEVSAAPVIFSHSSARALCGVPRNVPDDLLTLLAAHGGVLMVTFVPGFLTREGGVRSAARAELMERVEAEHPGDERARAQALEQWRAAYPTPATGISDVADHIDHIRAVAGIDHIGVGSDFGGSPSMPSGLEDVSRYPALFAELAERGYSDDDLAKVAGRNVLRVMREAEGVSIRSGGDRRGAATVG